jgi:hypothetical protein
VLLPKPVAECQYWHRSLNPKKLISVGFRCAALRCAALCSAVLVGAGGCGAEKAALLVLPFHTAPALRRLHSPALPHRWPPPPCAALCSHLAPRMTMARTLKLYRLPDQPQTPGLRQMENKDVPQVRQQPDSSQAGSRQPAASRPRSPASLPHCPAPMAATTGMLCIGHCWAPT